MIKIIKDIKVYTPDYVGVKDVLIVAGKIGAIEEKIGITSNAVVSVEIINGSNKILVPGFIDSNPATNLKLRHKGQIAKGMDADLVILDEGTLEIDTVIAMGITMIENKKIKVYGTFEKQN